MVADTSVRSLKAELSRLGIDHSGCVEKQELLEMLQSQMTKADPTQAVSVRSLKAELSRLGIDHSSCVEKRELLEKLEVHKLAQAPGNTLVPCPTRRQAARVHRGVLLSALQNTLALQGTKVLFLDMRQGKRAKPLALEDAVEPPLALEDAKRPLALEDIPRRAAIALTDGQVQEYEESRIVAYQAASTAGCACTVLALPASQRIGSDACTTLLAYRHGPVLALPASPQIDALRNAYTGHKLFETLEIDVNMFHETWDWDFTTSPYTDADYINHPVLRGGLPYIRPVGWRRFGLRVDDRFTDLDWLAMDGRPGEWAVAYHGTAPYAVRPITKSGLRAGGREGVERTHGAMYGDGVYCTSNVECAAFFAEPALVDTEDGARHYQVVFQCRVRPGGFAKHMDPVFGEVLVVKSEADIRPYAMLLGECSEDGSPTLPCRDQLF